MVSAKNVATLNAATTIARVVSVTTVVLSLALHAEKTVISAVNAAISNLVTTSLSEETTETAKTSIAMTAAKDAAMNHAADSIVLKVVSNVVLAKKEASLDLHAVATSANVAKTKVMQ